MGKRRRKRGMKRNRNRPINDINHNRTNITVSFRAVIEPSLTADSTGPGGFQSIPLNSLITKLTEELGSIYKLYRFTHVQFQYQADPFQSTTPGSTTPVFIAMNYVPALETPITSWPNPLDLEQFEGPAVAFYASNRGAPYSWNIPSHVLNAMPYNWYETRPNSPTPSDFTQGQIFLKSSQLGYAFPILANFTCEFQTLEDPEFLLNIRPLPPLPHELARDKQDKRETGEDKAITKLDAGFYHIV
jgi:hypothetical protein